MLLLLLSLMFVTGACQDEDVILVGDGPVSTKAESQGIVDHYWYRGEKYPIYRDPMTSYVFFKNADKEKLVSELKGAGLRFLESDITECAYTGMELSKEWIKERKMKQKSEL